MKEWYRRIKTRRGSKIARVAVMRRLTVVIWNMLKHQEPDQCGGPEAARRRKTSAPTSEASPAWSP